jgi:hypothetical protein
VLSIVKKTHNSTKNLYLFWFLGQFNSNYNYNGAKGTVALLQLASAFLPRVSSQPPNFISFKKVNKDENFLNLTYFHGLAQQPIQFSDI